MSSEKKNIVASGETADFDTAISLTGEHNLLLNQGLHD